MIESEPGSIGSCARSMRCHVVLGGTNIDLRLSVKMRLGRLGFTGTCTIIVLAE